MHMQNISAHLIDGKAFAAGLRQQIAADVARLQTSHDCVPGLAVILVGDDPASDIYVRSKARQTMSVGMRSFVHRLRATTPQAELLDLIARLNADEQVHGILVQLPLPRHIDVSKVLDQIDPHKDVDGFHVTNIGKLSVGRDDGFIPCTPLGCLMLLRAERKNLSGLHAVVIGCSNIVGRPMAQLLLRENCTVVITHLATHDVAAETRRADIVIVAAGHPGLVRRSWIKPGATVIDVGINRVHDQTGSHIVGDVAFNEVAEVAGAITPVPGGVGPMTIACLLHNTLQAAQKGIETGNGQA
ncbi:bifunctional methylenetetrahydrofolate dehydrogenase/methenyltetrahydrofolate cyclohydrolase FolD [Komagataeibacter europaeus]|uniref:bifunctional methylenetetrahydrofolate dehydrogenase/methenyltetrahydrofolate cyclohydrolase FolD n=1 Tax=Komagataeibacter europaeus TaxID=33995 RepID=UPI00031E7EDE|nr:bifunctional methylenetetrahydrofolate dehydrogenase/methenyltetrahydrofolate cyclohydrolase FolD [Komagataeibacter europaeus]GBQ40252.1 bifunctional 5,10-methylene-tetrahydrofolate dehydrogenase/ 5,10-methylene-tetrahydrofolate cyclohydrolase [Komagataeibacter europaeus LMG 18890]